ncbi:MAG TPA: DMT family transporter [Xanthobacteraceae bacterium]|jgi:drug/metabolite transporter (DMT)-like permease|nr:DMT family transporter [Xanthobacteraceae bacterium]
MSWLVFAFSGPILWAASTHIDKYLVERYFKNSDVAVLLVFTALIGLITLPFIGVFAPGVAEVGLANAALMAFSGVLYMGAMVFYLQALQTEEASEVAPFFQAGPLLGFVLGYVVLGETLSPAQMAGGALIVGGTFLVSLRSEPHTARRSARFNMRLAVLMLACALSLAVSSLIFKIFALRDEFWPTTFWMFAGEALFGAALLCVASYRRQFIDLLRSNPVAVLSINTVNELINLGGGLGTRFALTLAPLGLVQAIGSTTTLFVFGVGVLLSVFFPTLGRESLSRRELLHKGVAAVLVAAGAALVSR